jgi:hypothetical protein
MTATLQSLEFRGALLRRGFWLYIWEIDCDDGRKVHYVGKTGDKASGVSQSPFDRLSKHLGSNKHNNALRRHLAAHTLDPECCHFRFLSYGPLHIEEGEKSHSDLCDITSALEHALACDLRDAGYVVLNDVKCRQPLDAVAFAEIRQAFAKQFPKLDRQ